jgi:hypothetical protein
MKRIPATHINVCSEIVRSWLKKRSNYIIVAPPMSDSRQLFSYLATDEYVFSVIGKELYNMAIARMDTADFRDELVFARKVATKWGVIEAVNVLENDPVTILNIATVAVKEKNRVPIIIIHRFHEALGNLGESIGTVLRNLEHDLGLKTVVELPISLPVLRERWELTNRNKSPFLASDWGQGHRNKCLKGFSDTEITALLVDNGVSPEFAADVHKITGGLAEIVHDLTEDLSSMRRGGVEPYIKSRTKELCKRLVDWLDASAESHTYKKLVAKALTRKLDVKEAVTLSGHDWGGVILNKDGELNFKMLGWECLARLSVINENPVVASVEKLLVEGNFQEALDIISLNLDVDRFDANAWELLRKIICVCKIFHNIFGSDDNWREAKGLLEELKALNPQQRAGYGTSIDMLVRWEPLTDLMCDYFLESKINHKLRFEEFVCKYCLEQQLLAFWQLLNVRLNSARSMPAFQALQSVITHPEAMLQVYAKDKLGICFWKMEQLVAEEVAEISEFIKIPFRTPSKDAVLGFSELLYISTSRESKLDPSCRLIADYQEMQNYLELYEIRKRQVHSTSFVSPSDWENYSELCESMLRKIVGVYGVAPQNVVLPTTASILSLALNSFKETTRS